MDRSLTLDSIRSSATRLFAYICVAHIPVVALIALIARNDWMTPALIAAAVAVVAGFCAWRLKDGIALRAIMAACLTCGPVLFVFAGRGHHSGISGVGDWQVDYHMYFFGIFAMLAAYIDWRPIAIAAALTAGHHLVLDLIVPQNVFPEEGLDRVAVHAIAVVAECGVLFWMTGAINTLFAKVKEANDLVEFTSSEMAEQLAREQTENTLLKAQLAGAQV